MQTLRAALAVVQVLVNLVAFIASIVAYIRRNDHTITSIPHSAISLSPTRWTEGDIELVKQLHSETPLTIEEQLPPRTGRRYIVIGGAGFLGGYIVLQLIQRGEHPESIRILDVRPPTRRDLCTGRAKDVQFLRVDITDPVALDAAFHAPWPRTPNANCDLTVFHTAAALRFFERRAAFLPLSETINVGGTQNIVDASRSSGASILISTSSSTLSLRKQRFLPWPWEKQLAYPVQVVKDDDNFGSKHHGFSNYSITKLHAERIVLGADKASTSRAGVLRTGCLRPGHVIYGPGCAPFDQMLRNSRPATLTSHQIASHIYVENCVLGHLLYEQRLLELSRGGTNPDIGGQAFCIADPGPPTKWSDIFFAFTKLSEGRITFVPVSPTALVLFSYLVETYCIVRHYLVSALPFTRFIPALPNEILMVQPPMFNTALLHCPMDDSRARLPPEKGGLGYVGLWSTMEGIYKSWYAYDQEGLLPPRTGAAATMNTG